MDNDSAHCSIYSLGHKSTHLGCEDGGFQPPPTGHRGHPMSPQVTVNDETLVQLVGRSEL